MEGRGILWLRLFVGGGVSDLLLLRVDEGEGRRREGYRKREGRVKGRKEQAGREIRGEGERTQEGRKEEGKWEGRRKEGRVNQLL